MSWLDKVEKDVPIVDRSPAAGGIDLVSLINTKLAHSEVVPPPTPTTTYRISGLYKFCGREETLRALYGIEKRETIGASLQRTFDFGTAFHSLVQDRWLGRWGVLWGNWQCNECAARYEAQCSPAQCARCGAKSFGYRELSFYNQQHRITGHSDGVVLHETIPYVLELKTCNSRMFKQVSDYNRAPMANHIIQVNAYMWIMGIHRSVILYFDKDESLICQFEIPYDKALMERILGSIDLTRKTIAAREVIGTRVCEKSDCARARSCPVRKQCFEQRGETK